MVELGRRIVGVASMLTEPALLEPGKTYEVRVQAREGILDPEGVANYLLSELNNSYPEAKVNWIFVCNLTQEIKFQFTVVPMESLGFTPRVVPMSTESILFWLSPILSLIGIVAIAISLFAILGTVPWYVWGLMFTGVIMFLFSGPLSKAFTPTYRNRST